MDLPVSASIRYSPENLVPGSRAATTLGPVGTYL